MSPSGVFHDNIVTTIECFYENEDLWIVMQYFPSISLNRIIKYGYAHGINDRLLISYILRNILIALDRIHSSSTNVKALKPSKVLINIHGCVKIIDCQITGKIREELCKKYLVPPHWTAPEVINGFLNDMRSDIWSFGILVLEMLTGKNPWETYPYLKSSLMISEKAPPKVEKEIECDSFLKEITGFCLQKDPQKRPTANMLLENHYFQKINIKNNIFLSIWKFIPSKELKTRKLVTMPQPMPLAGEDPDEMLISEEDEIANS